MIVAGLGSGTERPLVRIGVKDWPLPAIAVDSG